MTGKESESRWIYRPEPLSVGGIIDKTLQIYGEYLREFFIPAGIYATPMTLFFYLSLYMGITGKNLTDPEALTLNAISTFMGWFLFVVLSATVIGVTGKIVERGPVSLSKAFFDLLGMFFPYMITTLLNGIVIIAVAVLSALPLLPLIRSFSFSSVYSMIILPILGFIILMADMYLISMLMLVSNVSVIEGKFYFKSLIRSIQLFNADWDSRWKVLTIPALIQGLIVLFSILIPFLGYTITLLLTPLSIISLTLVYYDIRFRTEGLDLELRISEINSRQETDGQE